MPPRKGKNKTRSRASSRSRKGTRPPKSRVTRWSRWLFKAAVVYLLFNLALNGALATTRAIDVKGLFELGYLDSRSEAALLLLRHRVWHVSWEDEQAIGAAIIQVAREEEVDPKLLQALVEAESSRKPHAVSPVGACGLAQLMPSTARMLKVSDPFDPRENLRGAAKYLRRLSRRFDGNLELTLAAYNAGPEAVARAGGLPPYRETAQYVKKITNRYRSLMAKEKP